MPFSEYFLNKVHGSQLFQSASACVIYNFGKVHLLAEHDCKVRPMGEVVISDVTNLEDDLSGLSRKLHISTLQSSGSMNLAVTLPDQIFDSFKSIPYPYPIPGLEHPPATSGNLRFSGYNFSNMQAMHWDSHAHNTSHSQFSVETTGNIAAQAVQARAADELIPNDE